MIGSILPRVMIGSILPRVSDDRKYITKSEQFQWREFDKIPSILPRVSNDR